MASQNSKDWPGRFKERVRFFMGLDLGQSHDPTAICVIKRTQFQELYGHPKYPETRTVRELFQCGYLERLPLGTTYPRVVSHVANLLQRPIWKDRIDLSIDGTGVGRPVVDMFDVAKIPFTAVTITGGDTEVSVAHNDYRVPKIKLVSGIQALLHAGTLQIQKELADAETLVRELQDFRVAFSDAGRMTFNAREGKHDDLVLALAIAVWNATQPDYECSVEPLNV